MRKLNIIFIGGIHGSGKSSFIKPICTELGVTYLSASDLIKWIEISPQSSNKMVSDINYTQELLLLNLREKTKEGGDFILDGHFCLLNKEGVICKVPNSTFEGINPSALLVLKCDSNLIKSRLEDRDRIKYNLDDIIRMQNNEINYANEIGDKLNIPLCEVGNNDQKVAIDFINNIFDK